MEQIGKISKRKPKPAPPLVVSVKEALQMKDPINALWLALVAAVFTDKDNPSTNYLSPVCKNLYLLDVLDREVKNGGFDQFFYNTSGSFCQDIPQALKEVGAVELSSIFDKACSVFPDGIVPGDSNTRRLLLEELSENAKNQLDAFDQEFCESSDNPWELALRYMRLHESAPLLSRDD